MPSKMPGAMMSSCLSRRSFSRWRAGVVAMSVLSVQCARDGVGEQIYQVVGVVEVVKTDDCPLDRFGAPTAGDPVGERVELRDEFVVGNRVGGRAVWLVDAGVVFGAIRGGHGDVGAELLGD